MRLYALNHSEFSLKVALDAGFGASPSLPDRYFKTYDAVDLLIRVPPQAQKGRHFYPLYF
jgi:hypothetical protein